MHISGITTCVGPIYAAYLERTLPVWLGTMELTIVASTEISWHDEVGEAIGGATAVVDRKNRPIHGYWWYVLTDAFHKHGAHFNKGAALNAAYAQASPSDWVLSIDCDVLPPPNWRDYLADIEPGYLYGCHRSDKRSGTPYGYFQLWHTSDAQARPFAECYDHAGRYDTEFMERWPESKRRMLPFTVEHLGEPAKHWHGPGKEHLTKAMLSEGVGAYRARDEKLVSRPGMEPGQQRAS